MISDYFGRIVNNHYRKSFNQILNQVIKRKTGLEIGFLTTY